jgi:hypothetical protein
MARYFLGFDPRPGNLYREIIKRRASGGSDVIFVTLNYDMLIELAATDEGFERLAYTHTAEPGMFRILKLHGSPNFIPNMGGSTLRGIKWGSSARHVNAPVETVSWPDAKRIWTTEDSLAPAMSLYSAGKEVLFSDRFVARQQAAWSEVCRTASEVNIVGVRVWPSDTHVWGPLAESSARINYVGPDGSTFLDWAANHEGISEVIAKDFAEYVAQVA